MKTKVNILKKSMAVATALFFASTFAFADGEATEVFLTGSTNTPAGDYTVQSTSDVYHYQGQEFEVYKVYYDNPEMNMKIAVNKNGKCNTFIAFTDNYWFKYDCNKNGFGVRKVMFSNSLTKEQFNPEAYHDQSILSKQRKIEKKQAVGLVASYVPRLQG
jgi:hypothetical protein